jgi:hypothetical protein
LTLIWFARFRLGNVGTEIEYLLTRTKPMAEADRAEQEAMRKNFQEVNEAGEEQDLHTPWPASK